MLALTTPAAPSRRDDMESLGYCLLALLPGHLLPWAQHLQLAAEGAGQEAERADAIQATMLETTIAGLCRGAPSEY